MKRTLFLPRKPLVGLDISHTYVKVMAINAQKKQVTGYGSLTIDPIKMRQSLSEDPSYLSECLRSLLTDHVTGVLPSNHAIIGIPTSLTYSRSLSLPNATSQKLDEAIMLEADQYIPIPVSELNVSYEILQRSNDRTEILMSAAPKKTIEHVVTACELADIIPYVIEPSINSVARLVALTEEGNLPTIIVDIGAVSTDLAVIRDKIRANASMQVGGNTFTYALSKHLKTSIEKAHQLKVISGLAHGPNQRRVTEALQPSLAQITEEIQKIIRYYNDRIDQKNPIQQIVIVGSGANVPGLGEYFTDTLIMPVRIASPWQSLNFGALEQPPKQFRPRYLTVAGLSSVSMREATS